MDKTKSDSIEADLTCSLCQELFDNPKDLDCPHVFCFQCLEDWVKAKTDSNGAPDGITCPECSQKTLIPEEGVSVLKTNVRLRNLSEKYASRKANVSICEDHDEVRHFYCVTCEIAVCHVCLKVKHEAVGHAYRDLKDISRNLKIQMQVTLTDARKDVDKQMKKLKHVSRAETAKVQQAAGLSLVQIKKRVQEMVIDIQRRGDALQAEIQKLEKDYMQKLSVENERIEQDAKGIQKTIEAMESTIDKTPDHEYVTQHAGLMERVKTKLRLPDYRNLIPDLNLEDFHFHPGAFVTANVFGQLPTKICEAKLIEEIGGGIFKKAQGIASTRTGILAIADTDSNRVCVYQRKAESGKYEFSFWLCSEDMSGTVHRPFDVAVLTCGTMFVTSKRQVKVFSSTGQFEKAFLTLNSGPSRITSTNNNHVMVSDDRKKIITVHKSSGEVVSKYPITNTAINIATNGRLIAFTNQSHGNVCVIDGASGEEHLNFQVGLDEATTGVCFVDSCNSLLVSVGKLGDTGRDRIEQYCCLSGKLVTCVLSGLFAPMCLTMLNDNELAVADVGRVQIYNLKFSDHR